MARNRQQTSRKIRQAAVDLLCREGFESWGINAIAREAEVDKVLIYRYFESLDNLLESTVEQTRFWPDPENLNASSAEAFITGTIEILDSDQFWKALVYLPEKHPSKMAVFAKQSADLTIWLEGFLGHTSGSISDNQLLRLPAMIQFIIMTKFKELTATDIWNQVSPPLEWNAGDSFEGFEELPTELL